MGENMHIKFLVLKPEGKRLLARPICELEDSIKVNLKGSCVKM
jgi:hypothetical protein